jgi:hypothetical protein
MLQSDFIVFYLPFILAMMAYGIAYWSSGFCGQKPTLRIVTTLAFSFSATFLSLWLYMVVALNKYGG